MRRSNLRITCLLAAALAALPLIGCRKAANESTGTAAQEQEQGYPHQKTARRQVTAVALNFPGPPLPQPAAARRQDAASAQSFSTEQPSRVASRENELQLLPPSGVQLVPPTNTAVQAHSARFDRGYYGDDYDLYSKPTNNQPSPTRLETSSNLNQVVENPHFHAAPRLAPIEFPTQPAAPSAPPADAWSAPAPSVTVNEPVSRVPAAIEEPTFCEPIVRPRQPEVSQPSAMALERGPSKGNPRALAAVASQAEGLNKHAVMMAQRGAIYSARAEFIQVLRRLTQAQDAMNGTRRHSEALAAAFRALEEAEDFIPSGAALEGDIDLFTLIESHRTPVLKQADMDRLTSLAAIQEYYTYAQEQFVIAGGSVPTASRALFGLGRLQESLHAGQSVDPVRVAPRAMVFYQAALMVDQENYRAANELGVLLAHFGQLETAKDMLLHGATVGERPESWHNLAVVHQRLGEQDLARRAQHEAGLAANVPATRRQNSDDVVRWVNPQAFAQAPVEADGRVQTVRQPAAQPTPAQPASTRGNRGFTRFLPWSR